MRIFVYEYTCAREAGDSPLRAEGEAMLAAVLEDFARVPGAEVVTLVSASSGPEGLTSRDREGAVRGPLPHGRGSSGSLVSGGMPLPDSSRVTYHSVTPHEEELPFRAEARAADFTLVIAPEFDDLLAARCRCVEEEGGRLLGPSSDAVRLTADKRTLAEHLGRAGVPTPPCFAPAEAASVPFPAVCKPRFGAGSQATFLLHRADELPGALARFAAEGWAGELLLQPFVPGQAASVAFLIGPRQCVPLLPAEQRLSADGRFHYLGGRVPLAPELAGRARALAGRAVAAVPGLRGYVGVDLVFGADAAGDAVIEINPRLTTSYVGLRRLARGNLAEAMLRVVAGREPVEVEWRDGSITFAAGGPG